MIETNYSIDGEQLSYELEEKGYMIYKGGTAWIHQYEPYIPNRELSYEENAIAQIEEIIASHEASQKQPTVDEQIADLEAQLEALKAMQVNE